MSPTPQVLDRLQAVVDDVQAQYAFAESFLRAAKVGSRMDVEIDFVLGDDTPVHTVADCDEVRDVVHGRLAELGYDRSAVVTFTTERRWAQ